MRRKNKQIAGPRKRRNGSRPRKTAGEKLIARMRGKGAKHMTTGEIMTLTRG